MKLTNTDRKIIAGQLAGLATTESIPEWARRPGESYEELRALAVKLGILAEFELAVVQWRTENAGGNANEGLLQ